LNVAILTELLSVPAAALLVYAALHDFAARTVPNWLPLAIFGLGVALRLDDHGLIIGLLICAVTFAVLFGIWLLGAVGGGDVKLWAATALLIPPLLQPQVAFFTRVVLLGGGLALLYLLLCLVVPKPRAATVPARQRNRFKRVLRAEAWRIGRRAPLPYAFAISASAIMTLLPLSFSVR
jgi:prepilin peptidase CpaA